MDIIRRSYILSLLGVKGLKGGPSALSALSNAHIMDKKSQCLSDS